MKRLVHLVFLFLGIAFAGNSIAQAGDPLDRGIQLRREGRDEEALHHFRRAYEQHPSPRVRAQIGLAQQALGNWMAADEDLREALKHHDDPWIAKNREVIEDGISEIAKHLGSLLVDTGGTSIEIWLDGALAGTAPGAPIKISAGRHELELRGGGRGTMQRSLDVPSGGTVLLQLDWTLPPAPVKHDEPMVRPVVPAIREGVSTQKVVAWSLATASALFLIEAVIAQIVRENVMARYNDDALCAPPGSPIPRSERCGQYLSDVETAQTAAAVGMAMGFATGLGSAYFFVRDASSSGSPQKPPSAPRGFQLGWRLQF